jgi:colanic acid/amylovoran biosynthesis glycosyltransferase
MKVTHLCRAFSKLPETFIYDVITELEQTRVDQTKVENEVLTFKRLNTKDRPFEKVQVLEPSSSMRFKAILKKGLSRIGLSGFNASETLHAQRQELLYNYLQKNRPNVIHAHFGLQGYLIASVALRLNIPFIVCFHGYDAFRLPKAPIWYSRYQEIFAAASAVTVVSKYMMEHLKTLGCPASKLHVIHVGKNIDDYHYRNTLNTPVRNFISVGRLAEKKGFLDCLAAFKLLLKQYPDLKLKIVGTGELEPEIRSMLDAEGLHNNITLLGALQHHKVKEALQAADAFILCSKTGEDGDKEGIPTVLMEAQAMGLPCISTLHSGIPEVFPEVSKQLLAKEGDPVDIAEKIHTLLDMPEDTLEEIRLQGRKLVEEAFNLKIETAKLIRLMQTFIK